MQKKSKIVLGAAAVVAVAAAVGFTQFANADRAPGGWGMGHWGMGGGPMMMRMMDMKDLYDTNKDGKVTQEEIDQVRQSLLAEFDADKSSGLSLKEYEGLWLKLHHERMVRSFQALDRDGDGIVTAEEFKQPLSGIVARLDQNGDKALGADDRPAGPMDRMWGHRHHRGMDGGGMMGQGPDDDGGGQGPSGN